MGFSQSSSGRPFHKVGATSENAHIRAAVDFAHFLVASTEGPAQVSKTVVAMHGGEEVP